MIWTISDLHLSFAQPKPMDIFGTGWKDHPQRIAAQWRARVAAEDWVLIAGDISWAMKLAQVKPDLEWIDALPGRKVLIRGNHDYWCPRSVAGFRRHLPPSLSLIGAGAVDIGSAVVCGTRGWVTPDTPGFTAADQPIYERELQMLDRALLDGRAVAAGRPLIVMLHFPPFVSRQPSEFARRVIAAGAASCLYGHLHRRYDWDNAVQGPVDGVSFQLTACDYLGFGPVAVRGLRQPLEPAFDA
jgi:predicted phosphohydrolase